MKKSMFAAGIGICIVGLGIAASVPYFYYRSHTVSANLLTRANKEFQVQTTSEAHRTGAVIPTNLQPDTLLGEIDIPKLSLKAPIVEGVQDKEINVAVGHLPTSVLPGQNGTSILAAHNATWFRHVDELKSGDELTVKTSYGTYTFVVKGARVVHVGDPVVNTSNSSVVLEACYPLNALYLTLYRYLVFADLKDSNTTTSTPIPIQQWSYAAKLPPALPATDTNLAYNSLPLGKLVYEGSPSASFVQSNAPLSASNALVSLYLAWQHATASDNQSYLSELIDGPRTTNLFLGFPVSLYRYQTLFDVTLNVQGDKLVSATATDIVTLHHTFRITVNADAQGKILVLRSVEITPYG